MNPRRVLVVEDSALCVKLFTIALEQAGFKVTVARSVPEALIQLRREMPDVLLCDLLLGLLGNGYDVVTAVRASGAKIRCIAMTGLPADEIECHALGAGFDLLLRKPFLPSRLISELLEGREMAWRA
jgi:DNA-binding response OmpR family regulator